jgi:hypothetical protein
MPVKPITPREATSGAHIPDIVIETVNDYLRARGGASRIVLHQDELVTRLVDEKGLNRKEIFDKGWLNFEDLFRKSGWKVEYEKPGFNEADRAYYVFDC